MWRWPGNGILTRFINMLSSCCYRHVSSSGCQYVLHSTAQLYSHKRKHERREFEHAYRNYRQLQQQSQAGRETALTSTVSKVQQQSTQPQRPTAATLSNGSETAQQDRNKVGQVGYCGTIGEKTYRESQS